MAVPDPYTHAKHARRCVQAAEQGVVLAQQRVQVRKRGVLYCARIQHAYTTPDGIDCWTVEAEMPEQCRMTVLCRNVRLCGDAACSCVTADDATAPDMRSMAGAGAAAVGTPVFMGGASNTSQTAHG